MDFDRTLSDDFSKLLEEGEELRWLYEYVKNREDLDFLTGRNKDREWISIYRGLTRIVSIIPKKKSRGIILTADNRYKHISKSLYGPRNTSSDFRKEIEDLIEHLERNPRFDRYYRNRKEGYYQTLLSRKFGLSGSPSDQFVIIDKESVIGYSSQQEKNSVFGILQKKYKQLQKEISILDPERYGTNLEKKAIGNELDFLALDKNGNILLIEYKHGTNTSGIYLSPLQLGLYYDIFTSFPKVSLERSIINMLAQKQKIGLINPRWIKPDRIKEIIPVLIISEYNYKSSAKEKFTEILQFVRSKVANEFLSGLLKYNFKEGVGLTNW